MTDTSETETTDFYFIQGPGVTLPRQDNDFCSFATAFRTAEQLYREGCGPFVEVVLFLNGAFICICTIEGNRTRPRTLPGRTMGGGKEVAPPATGVR